ncbi:MAG: TRAP transporter small permease subunit [Desulfurococcaceae archaeon]
MIKRITFVINRFLFLCVLTLVFLTVYSTVLRYIFREPDVRAFFLSTWLWGIIFLLGFGYALYENAHIRVDLLYNHVSMRMRKILFITGLSVCLISLIVVLPNYVQLAWRSYLINERDSTIPIFSPPVWWYKWLLVFTSILAVIQILSVIMEELKK